MPVVGIELEKSPLEECQVQRTDVGIIKDVHIIVPQDEVILENLKICYKGSDRDKSGNDMFIFQDLFHTVTDIC
jgi:hypothetical protein